MLVDVRYTLPVADVDEAPQTGPAAGPEPEPVRLSGSYLVTLTARAGRWEITSLDTQPHINERS